MSERLRNFMTWLLCTLLVVLLSLALQDVIENRWLRILAAAAIAFVSGMLATVIWAKIRFRRGTTGE